MESHHQQIKEIYSSVRSRCFCNSKLSYQDAVRLLQEIIDIASFHNNHDIQDTDCRELLLTLSLIRTLGEVFVLSVKVCKSLWGIKEELIHSDIPQKMIMFLENEEKIVKFAAKKTLTTYFCLLPASMDYLCISLNCLKNRILENTDPEQLSLLCDILMYSSNSYNSVMTVDSGLKKGSHPNWCKEVIDIVTNSWEQELKRECLTIITEHWSVLKTRCLHSIFSGKVSCEQLLETFLQLWQCILQTCRQDRNSVSFLKQFPLMSDVRSLLLITTTQTTTLICRMCLDVLNEVISMESIQADSIKNLSVEEIVSEMATCNWLEKLPPAPKFTGFGGTVIQPTRDGREIEPSGASTVLTRKVIIFVLKCCCLLVYTSREQAEKLFISLEKWAALQCQEIIASSTGRMNLAEWLIPLFLDQDDQLFEVMLLSLKLYINCKGKKLQPPRKEKNDILNAVNPHRTFLTFVGMLGYDHKPLIDFLISNETCMLTYIVTYLKVMNQEWEYFVCMCQEEETSCDRSEDKEPIHNQRLHLPEKCDAIRNLHLITPVTKAPVSQTSMPPSVLDEIPSQSNPKTMFVGLTENDNMQTRGVTQESEKTETKSKQAVHYNNEDKVSDSTEVSNNKLDLIFAVLIRLRLSIERLCVKNIFPYNPKPLVKLLQKCENKYESG
ncbi:protein lines homolog [Tachypleus tridentatus]|uniref:protein lines homolog n=1 Tax=Tachypleus tridentatus TaxID=6853 RepID=UPI003FD2D664